MAHTPSDRHLPPDAVEHSDHEVIEMLFGEAVRRMVDAFEKRAAHLYG